MAEHPMRVNASEDSPGTRGDNGQTFEDLRNLLLGREKKEIAGLRDRIENPVARAADVSAVVAEAIELRRERGGKGDLNKALAPSVEDALRESVRKDPSALADALFPVMGPAIRKSIAESIRSMLESFNQALEHSFSIEGVRWRIESVRTGKPFAEIVFLHTLLYRVEQVFLIHKATGLMLGHCVAPRVAMRDPALVSGMFSAIQSYVRDSFKAPKEDNLDSLQVGELEVWVEDGPYAILAAVIRGHAPASYRATLKKTIEEIHRDFAFALERFDGDSTPLAAADRRLELCLESHSHLREPGKRKYLLPILSLVVLVGIGIWGAIALQKQRMWNRFLDELQSQPGIVVTSSGKENGRYLVRGLRDPLASDPELLLKNAHIDSERVRFRWAPFYAIDDESVERRAIEILQPPAGVTLSVRDGLLGAVGRAPSEWARNLRDRAAFVPGLKNVDTSKLEEVEQNEISQIEAALTSTIFTFPIGSAEVVSGEEGKFGSTAEQIELLFAKLSVSSLPTIIDVVGHTDNSGGEALNLSLSQRRSEYVARKLVEKGVARRYLSPRGVGTSEPVQSRDTEGGNQLDRSVTFRILPSKPLQDQ